MLGFRGRFCGYVFGGVLEKHKGFTMVELLVIIVVTMVIVSMAFPAMSSTRRDLAVRGAVDEFRGAHNLARAVAVRSSRVAQLWIDGSAETFWVQTDTSVAGTQVMDTIGGVVELDELNVTVASNRSVLCFDPRGVPTTQGACDGTQSAILIFASAGKADTVARSEVGMLVR